MTWFGRAPRSWDAEKKGLIVMIGGMTAALLLLLYILWSGGVIG